ncbi:piggyBac transposable element-derived protein 4-like [Acanthaster planci]|uniref:PiggyBac transposable element-derived protein 4-like n=1 Tax=Acanthaster planci TaxID=133434 RepID=A0A8B7YRK1_ACAPL|nr:piggyBac transposable element-derived protein 4-like [Acanthaster planci]
MADEVISGESSYSSDGSEFWQSSDEDFSCPSPPAPAQVHSSTRDVDIGVPLPVYVKQERLSPTAQDVEGGRLSPTVYMYVKQERLSPTWQDFEEQFPTAEAAASTSTRAPSFQWNDEDSTPLKYGFTGNGGAVDPRLHPSCTCSESFGVFFDNVLYSNIVQETNRFAAQRPVTTSAHMRSWTDVNSRELKAFLGLYIMMGITKHPTLHSYWSTDPLLKANLFPSVMPRDRFLAILQALHFNDNSAMPEDCPDRLFKLRPVIDHLLERFSTAYIPQRDIAVDDSSLKFFGCLRFGTYNPRNRKKARFGIKAYKLCQSTGNAAGYCYNFKIYTGQSKGELPAATQVVMDLVSSLNGKGYNLALDRAFSSPDLYRRLYCEKFNVVGTVMPNRKGMPEDLKSVKLQRGETAYQSADLGANGSLLAMVWKDQRNVCMLSTMHTAEIRGTGKRDRTGAEKRKPACVIEYNALMGGVDKSEQLAASHRAIRKSMKWYKKLFFYLLDLTLVNSYCVHLAVGHRLSFLDFRLQLVRELLDEPLPHYRPQRDAPPVSNSRFVGRHFPIVVGKTDYGEYRYRRCVVCSSKGLRKKTRHECDSCNMPLCIDPCFREYHTVH